MMNTDHSRIVAGVVLLLGEYAGATEASLVVRHGAASIHLQVDWTNDESPDALLTRVRQMLDEGTTPDNQEKDCRFALCLDESTQAGLTDFDLVFRVDGGEYTIDYDASRYAPDWIHTMTLTWQEIRQSLSTAARIADVRVTAPEPLDLLDGFNDTKRPYDRSATIVDMFRTCAAGSPGNVAVIYEDRSLTYAEVDTLTDKIAQYISRQGLGRGDTVAVFINRSEYMVVASLGVLKAGCAYEPLDPNYPDERLAFMVKDAGSRLMIVDDRLCPRLAHFKEFQGPVLRLSEVADLPNDDGTVDAQGDLQSPHPEDLFTLIYTSGTTGVPKGVRLLHRNIMAYAAWYRRYFAPTAESRITCYNSYGFDGSLTDMYPALTVGAAVVIIPEEKKLDLPALADIIRKHHVEIADLPSQVGRQFALTMDCPSLRYIVGGGEKLVPFHPTHPYIFANQYGPTEATVAITCYNMTDYEQDVPIGKPMDNTAIYVVDAAGRRVPPGALGELWVAGEQVTGGYLNRLEKTREVFVPNPFSKDKSYETAYRTGDIVRYRMDGNIEFVGRRDGLVKIRGFRVELAEVEGVVRDFPPVRDAAVVAMDNPAGGQFIAAFVVADTPIEKEALAAFIRESKPPYMVPAAIVQVEAIPHTQNGKLDRKALPVPDLHVVASDYVAPRNETEAAIVKGFEAALGMERVSAEEDFFEAGGDSLALVRLLAECRDLRLNFKLVYEGKSPTGIAQLLEERDKQTHKTHRQRTTHLLCPIPGIHYLWGNELEEGYGVHCDATLYLSPETDLERLADAVEQALKAHPAVDARLTVMADGGLRWKDGDLSGLRPQVESITRAEYDAMRGTLRRPMNKPGTRMFTMRVFAVTEADGQVSKVFYLDFLHPIIDGVSIEIFLADVDAAYRGETLAQEEWSIFDFYDEIEDVLGSEAYQKEVEWNHNFATTFAEHLCEVTGDLDPGDENTTIAITEPLLIDLAETDRFTKSQSITDGTLLAAAFGLVQGHCNGEQAGVTLTFYDGRDDIRYERTMGAIYRHYPLCVRWTDETTAAQFVKETQDSIMSCRRHALYDPDPVPLITSFAYQGEDADAGMPFCGGLARYEEVEDHEDENFNFYVHRRHDDFYVCLTYNTKAYSEAFVARFLKNYATVLHGLAVGRKPSEIEKQLPV